MTPPTSITAEMFDAQTLAAARAVAAGILVVVRATRQHRTVNPTLRRRLDTLSPQVYLWHWFAWKMGGFKPEVDLGATADGKVVVVGAVEILYGDPLTEEVATFPVETSVIEAVANPSADSPVVRPKSRYTVH